MLVDLKVHYAKAGGKSSPKVFKLKSLTLAPRAKVSFAKTLSLADMTTRKHHPGTHRVEAILNGQAIALGNFQLAGVQRTRKRAT